MLEQGKLLDLAEKYLRGLDLDTLHRLNIWKRREMFASSSIQVAYPPLKSLRLNRGVVPSLQSGKKNASVYVHIPFCTGTCSYCGFARQGVPGTRDEVEKLFDNYLSLLGHELSLLRDTSISSIRQQQVHSIYIGGGTPTILGADRLAQLIMVLRDKLNVPSWAEVTVEASPETISTEMIQALVESGCSRLSIGVQTFDENLLRQIGRRHTAVEAVAAVEKARRANLDNINIDLIRDLPGQDTKSLLNDLSHIESLGLPSVTIYHLIVKPRTRLTILNHSRPEAFPNEQDVLLHHLLLLEGMSKLGYTQWPVDWFLLDGQLDQCFHQKLKWLDDTDLIGIGCSAYSFCNNVQYYNHRSLADYGRSVQCGELPIAAAEELDALEQFHRRVIFGLRYEVDCQRLLKETGYSVENVFGPQIDRLQEAGLISLEENILQLTNVGKLFADEIMGEFYSQKVRTHSVAGV